MAEQLNSVETVRVEVRADRGPYSVAIGAKLLPRTADLLREAGLGGPMAVVSCAPVWQRHGTRLRGLMRGGHAPILIPDGERAKTMATVVKLYEAFASRALDRTATIVAFGGGVVGDVAGFAAATWLRGIRVVQVPTTLLAQVDSAIGGKTGVNLPTGKNLIGAFHSPALVICDTDVLVSLPPREFRSGLFEVIKYGVIASRPLFARVSAGLDHILAHDRGVVVPVVADCCRIKADVVTRDERESGPRRTLNFGHTIGHALEAVTSYRRYRHGEAVAYGMLAAARISADRGLLAADDEQELRDLIQRLGPLPPVADVPIARVIEATGRDKKVAHGRLHFVLASGIGATSIVDDVSAQELRSALIAIGLRK